LIMLLTHFLSFCKNGSAGTDRSGQPMPLEE
jgi:hypothetical protein